MSILVRKATKADMPQVLELIKELAVFEKDPDAVEITVTELEQNGFGENPLFTCFVAETDSMVVGMALVYFKFSTWKGRTVHLEDLVVKEAYRGKQIGTLLYSEVFKYAKENGVRNVGWIVLNWNKGAIKFYERSGAVFHKDWYLVIMDETGIDQYLES